MAVRAYQFRCERMQRRPGRTLLRDEDEVGSCANPLLDDGQRMQECARIDDSLGCSERLLGRRAEATKSSGFWSELDSEWRSFSMERRSSSSPPPSSTSTRRTSSPSSTSMKPRRRRTTFE